MRDIILIAHRGKGPTSNDTSPGEELWKRFHDKDSLVVPQDVLIENGKGLPDGIPPENTIAAFRKGLMEGSDAIELDIFLSKDGVPIAVHDDELNRNVSGARRSAQEKGIPGYLGMVIDFDFEDLQKFDMWNNNHIPSLNQVIALVNEFNPTRLTQNKNPIILNIEFKDNDEKIVYFTIQNIEKAVENNLISKKDIIFCSFKHPMLIKAIEFDVESRIALALKTVFLFGEENVDKENGWIVPMHVQYNKDSLQKLSNKVTAIQQKNKGDVAALDAVLWDINKSLVNLAKKLGIDLHASTSNFRDFKKTQFLYALLNMNKLVQVYFKTDEPGKILKLFKKINEAENETMHTEISRLPKPGQDIKQDIFKVFGGICSFVNNHSQDSEVSGEYSDSDSGEC